METANSTFRELTRKEHEFMARADRDLAARRQQNFINQLKKHPQFKPSMLEPPKPKFKAVSLDNGPIVRTHSRRSECCRHSTPQRAAPPPPLRRTAAPPLRCHATSHATSRRSATTTPPPLRHHATTSRTYSRHSVRRRQRPGDEAAVPVGPARRVLLGAA